MSIAQALTGNAGIWRSFHASFSRKPLRLPFRLALLRSRRHFFPASSPVLSLLARHYSFQTALSFRAKPSSTYDDPNPIHKMSKQSPVSVWRHKTLDGKGLDSETGGEDSLFIQAKASHGHTILGPFGKLSRSVIDVLQ